MLKHYNIQITLNKILLLNRNLPKEIIQLYNLDKVMFNIMFNTICLIINLLTINNCDNDIPAETFPPGKGPPASAPTLSRSVLQLKFCSAATSE